MSAEARERAKKPSLHAFLFGDPVAHSLSPVIHNAALDALGFDAEYRALKVTADGLPTAMDSLRSGGVLGANVTIPHKQAAVGMVDELMPDAKATGAVNTIVVRNERLLIGANTDVEGFLNPLASKINDLRGGCAAIFGAGGAARAACYALLTAIKPARLTIISRRSAQTNRLIADLAEFDKAGVLHVGSFEASGRAVRDSQLVVNATPVGMRPRDRESPWPVQSDFHAGQIVYDLVYAPTETRLLCEAASAGAAVIGGMAMLIAQAAASFKLWTGFEMPLEAVREALSDTF